MREFWVRTMSVAAIVGVLWAYNTALDVRAKDEEIARLSAQVSDTGEQGHEAAGNYQDGTYTGEADGFGGKVAVEVTIESGKLTDIEITSASGEDGAYLTMAEDVIPRMLEAQSADVDTISGATFSSGGIRDAAAQALEKAVE